MKQKIVNMNNTLLNLKNEAASLAENKNFDEALQKLHEVAKHAPDDYENWLNIGKLYHFKGCMSDAILALQKACALNPLSVDAINELGKAYLQISNEDEAQKCFLKSSFLSSENAESFLYLAQIWLNRGDIQRAHNLLSASLQKFDENPYLHNRFGVTCKYLKKLPEALLHHRRALELLISLPPDTMVNVTKESFDNKGFEVLLFEVLTLLHKTGYKAFACSGSLLGLVRENGLLAHDKDIDIGVAFEQLDEIVALLSNYGWSEYKNSYGLINPRAMRHKESGLMLDVCGHLQEESGKVIAGLWMDKIPFEENRITEYEMFDVCEVATKHGTIWQIQNPQSYLSQLYGDWQIPDSEFDTIIMAKNLRSFSPLTKHYALDKLFTAITQQNFSKAKSIVNTCLKHEPKDTLYLSVKHYLSLT